MADETLMLVDPAGPGSYKLPEVQIFYNDEPVDTLSTLDSPTKERGRLKYQGNTHMVTVYVERSGNVRLPYVLLSDLRKIFELENLK
jgi:hypothetical protein